MNELNECPECHSHDLEYDHERAEISCKKCGLVIDENIIDLGPEGGDEGGLVIATGTPEQIVKNKDSQTGLFLKKSL